VTDLMSVAPIQIEQTQVKRVAVLAYHCSPLAEPGSGDAGGMTVYVRALAGALAERGISTDVFTRATSDLGRMVELGDKVRVVAIQAGPARAMDKSLTPAFLGDFVAGVSAFATTQRVRYDLVHSHYWQSGLAGLELAKRWSVPLVHSHHSLGRVKNRWLAPGDAPEPPARLEGETKVISSADVLVASTDAEFEHLACLYGADHDRLRALHPGVDHQLFTPGAGSVTRRELGLPPDAAVLLCVGRIQRLKGLDVALNAAAQLQESVDRSVFLVIIGGASGRAGEAETDRLHSMAASLGIEDRVLWLGPLPHERLPGFYRAADAVLVCSHSESFGLAALESHACGTPVIGTAVGGLSHIVGDGLSGWLVDSRDPGAFAARLKQLLTDDRLRKSFADNAIARASRFSWDAAADEFLELYECLVRAEFPEVCTC
jgi:D-inositol-3-phosphate glycosyltransferase